MTAEGPCTLPPTAQPGETEAPAAGGLSLEGLDDAEAAEGAAAATKADVLSPKARQVDASARRLQRAWRRRLAHKAEHASIRRTLDLLHTELKTAALSVPQGLTVAGPPGENVAVIATYALEHVTAAVCVALHPRQDEARRSLIAQQSLRRTFQLHVAVSKAEKNSKVRPDAPPLARTPCTYGLWATSEQLNRRLHYGRTERFRMPRRS